MRSVLYEKLTGTTYGWSFNEHPSLPIETRFSSSPHSCREIGLIRMMASFLTTPSLTARQSNLQHGRGEPHRSPAGGLTRSSFWRRWNVNLVGGDQFGVGDFGANFH